MNRDDGQYHFTRHFLSQKQTNKQTNWQPLLLLQIVASLDTNAVTHLVLTKTVVCVETYTVSVIFWIRNEEPLNLLYIKNITEIAQSRT